MEEEIDGAREREDELSVIMFDLDHFKKLNDTHGHAAGDAVLRTVSMRLQKALRPYDGFGRIGGEEFLGVFPGCDLEQAGRVAERMRQILSEAPMRIPGGEVGVTASIGVATMNSGSEPGNAESIVASADNCLYAAKRGGRNRVELHRGELLDPAAVAEKVA